MVLVLLGVLQYQPNLITPPNKNSYSKKENKSDSKPEWKSNPESKENCEVVTSGQSEEGPTAAAKKKSTYCCHISGIGGNVLYYPTLNVCTANNDIICALDTALVSWSSSSYCINLMYIKQMN